MDPSSNRDDVFDKTRVSCQREDRPVNTERKSARREHQRPSNSQIMREAGLLSELSESAKPFQRRWFCSVQAKPPSS